MNNEYKGKTDSMNLDVIQQQITKEIQKFAPLTNTEAQVLENVKQKRHLRYRQIVFKLTGRVDTSVIMENYARLVTELSELRTIYLYRNMKDPVSVVLKEGDKVFPIHNLSILDSSKQTYLLKNVLATEARREFNMEQDSVLRLQGFLVRKDQLVIIISLYPHLPLTYGVRELMYRIFEGMHMDNADMPRVDPGDVSEINESYQKESLLYWKNLLLPLSKSLPVPGENTTQNAEDSAHTCYYGELSPTLLQSLETYCKTNNTTNQVLFLCVWGNILGRFRGEEHPVLAATIKGECMDLFPVIIDRSLASLEQVQATNNQITESIQHSGCSNDMLQHILGIEYPSYFHMIHHFLELSEIDQITEMNGAIAEIGDLSDYNDSFALVLNYHLFGEKIGLSYISKSGIHESVLEQLHHTFQKELERFCSSAGIDSQESMDNTNSFVAPDLHTIEPLEQKQKISYLKNSGLFGLFTSAELALLASKCKLKTYLVNDIIASEGNTFTGLYIIGDGNIEESCIAPDGIVKSIQILKKGDVFGVENILSDHTAFSSYTVASKEVKILYVDHKILTILNDQRPIYLTSLLKKEMDQKRRFQRLWTLD